MTSWDFVLGQTWVSFHVPAFLVIAGFLYARPAPIEIADVGRRLVRVVVPYTIASIVVYVLGIEDAPQEPIALALATGSARARMLLGA